MKRTLTAGVSLRPTLATDVRFGSKTGERAVGLNGEINANSNKELMQNVARLMQMASNGEYITTEEQARQIEVTAAVHREMLTASFGSKSAHMELGEVLADELYQAANREGFMRRFLAKQDLAQGQIPRVNFSTCLK